ncbi:hypothetical protein BD769DRAFT_1666157 [Suillus cothurnatus]|nr:hypothetical protein BD769DRAFT_1666157 [Suillus cothurnatus]
MLLTNQRLDKIAALRVDFTARKMLNSCAVSHLEDLVGNMSNENAQDSNGGGGAQNDDDGERNPLDPLVEHDEIGDGVLEGPRAQSDVKLACTLQRSRAHNIRTLVVEMDIPDLPQLVRLFLYDQLLADDSHNSDDVPLSACPRFEGPIKIFNSAAATFFAPSNPSGVGGMRREHICAVPSWQKGPPRYDTVFINTGSKDSINRMEVGRVLCFFSFCHSDTDTGLWMVRPSFHKDGS